MVPALHHSAVIASHVYAHDLGAVFAQGTGFHIESDPDSVRAPDVAFVSRTRTAQVPRRGYARLAPDLVVEIISSGDRRGELLAKVGQWLDAGAQLAWVSDPVRTAATVYRADGSVEVVQADGRLDGEQVLPGFTCALGDVFA